VLQEQAERLVLLANRPDSAKMPWLFGPDGKTSDLIAFPIAFRANVPQIRLEGDNRELALKGVSTRAFADTVNVYMGSLYVNDFNLFGRTWQVIVQAEPEFRTEIEKMRNMKVKNARGGMVPLGALGDARVVNGPLVLTRYNMYPAAQINGLAAPGVSSGQAIA